MTKKPAAAEQSFGKRLPAKITPEHKALAAQIEADVPYDRTLYVNECRQYIKRSVDDILAAGKILLVIQAREGKGNFMRIVTDEIGIPYRTAFRFMNTALKAEQYSVIKQQLATWQVGKVYALLEAPEEELQRFEQLGLFGEKDRDEVEAMSIHELRSHVRDLLTNQKKAIAAEVHAAKLENKGLRDEIGRLKTMVPNGPDAKWAEPAFADIEELFMRLESRLSSLAFDPRMVKDDRLKAQVEGIYKRIESRFALFLDKWVEYTGHRVIPS